MKRGTLFHSLPVPDLVYFLPRAKYKISALPICYAHNLAPPDQNLRGKCPGSPPLDPALYIAYNITNIIKI